MNGGSRASQVVDLIDLEQNGFDNIMANELESGIPKMVHHVLLPPREEIVNDDDIIASLHQLIDQMAPDEPCPSGDHNAHPPPPNPHRHPPDPGAVPATPGMGVRRNGFLVGDTKRPRSRDLRIGAEMRKAGLDDEESGANKNAHKDEQEPLFSEEIVDGSGQRSRVFQGFGGVRRRALRGFLISSVIHAPLLVQFHGDSLPFLLCLFS
ncbi:unnamed protein product [Cuscuta campestris]|uniref:Uncharacterized protein n=1 Tax=Cuscuta campestris TaxID=132261 RepID=A0A484MAB2_9ASTE|nr:unnamed protein product [Cuscuta campestris]